MKSNLLMSRTQLVKGVRTLSRASVKFQSQFRKRKGKQMVKSCFRTASGPRSQRENEGEIGEDSIRWTENLSEHQESVGISCAYVAGYLLRARDRSRSAACIQPFWAKPQASLPSRAWCENVFPLFENSSLSSP